MTKKKQQNNRRPFIPPRPPRRPSFEAGVLSEPLILFGGQHVHLDPKTGLGLYGPYTLKGQVHPDLTTITVGCVGPAQMLADAEQWLTLCQSVVTNDGSEPFLNPHFPGFNSEHPFACTLRFGNTWQERIQYEKIVVALREADFETRIRRIIRLYVDAIQVLSERNPRPSVVLCCIPQDIIDLCTVRVGSGGQVSRRKLTPAEKVAAADARAGQLPLFSTVDSSLGAEEDFEGHQNLRRGLKAEAMRFEIPTQIVWPRTLKLIDEDTKPGEQGSQDRATRAWNFATALYHKSGGTPWRLADVEHGTCFIGIAFYRDMTEGNSRIRTAMAQAFTSSGDGYVLRGNAFEWDDSQGRSPHMDVTTAGGLMRDVLELYKRQNSNSFPRRVVVHKTSRFWDDELDGLRRACEVVPDVDFVAFGWRGMQFYRPGTYPPLRGTYIKISSTNHLLYTAGYVPFLRTYPGARVPQPLEILEHQGTSSWDLILKETLGLTKMNWNTAAFACREPITIAFSRRVGHVLAELRPGQPMQAEYRFYM